MMMTLIHPRVSPVICHPVTLGYQLGTVGLDAIANPIIQYRMSCVASTTFLRKQFQCSWGFCQHKLTQKDSLAHIGPANKKCKSIMQLVHTCVHTGIMRSLDKTHCQHNNHTQHIIIKKGDYACSGPAEKYYKAMANILGSDRRRKEYVGTQTFVQLASSLKRFVTGEKTGSFQLSL